MFNFIGWSISWSLFWTGHLASQILCLRDTDRWAGFWYPVYNNLMIASYYVQRKAKLEDGPWEA